MEQEPASKKWEGSTWEAWLVLGSLSAAAGRGSLLNPEAFDALNQAQDYLEEKREAKKDDKDQRPPKPPRGKLVGRIAFQA